jgi:hypothetical protein
VRPNRFVGDALYIAWKLNTADAASAEIVQERLARGEDRKLYRLWSWVVANGEARALLKPDAPLEQIAAAIWENEALPSLSRWVEGRHACAQVAREIETVPVTLGLAARPEQWPFSSASGD